MSGFPCFSTAEARPETASAFLQTWQAIVIAELRIRLRDSNMGVLLACVAAACVLLTPPADAHYAVITFGGMKPLLSAGTSVAAAGAVFSVFMFPFYLLGLGIGCVRDRRTGTGIILATTPVDAIAVTAGRLIANSILVTVFSLLVLLLVTIVVGSRLHALPDGISVAAYLLVVIPLALLSVPLGALADRYLGDRNGARVALAFCLWIGFMLCSVLADSDAFGLRLLKENAPAGSGTDWSLGIISAENMLTVPWQVLNVTGGFVAERLQVMFGAVLAGGIVCLSVSPGMMTAISGKQALPAGRPVAAAPAVTMLPRRVRPAPSGIFGSTLIVSRQWLTGAKWVLALIVSVLCVAVFVPQSPRVTLSIAFVVPLFIANRKRFDSSSHGRFFERTTAAFWRPSPLLFTAYILGCVTAVPALPLLLQMPLMRTTHILLAMFAASLWLTWTCIGTERKLFGTFVYSLIWYLNSFGDIPPTVDLFGFGGTAVLSVAAVLGLVTTTGILVFRLDSNDNRSAQRNS